MSLLDCEATKKAYSALRADRIEISCAIRQFFPNFADSERQQHALKNVTNILQEDNGAEIEVVCHGGGIGLLVKQGVRFAACENTLRDKSIPKANLLPDVTTVPSGAVEVIRKQQEGFGYFKP